MRKILTCFISVLFLVLTDLSADGGKSPKINGFFVQPMLGYGVPNFQGGFQTQQYYDGWVKSMADIGATMLFLSMGFTLRSRSKLVFIGLRRSGFCGFLLLFPKFEANKRYFGQFVDARRKSVDGTGDKSYSAGFGRRRKKRS